MIKYLTNQLHTKVTLETTRSFQEFWNNVKLRRYDIVHYNQNHHLISKKKYEYEIFLKNEEHKRTTISSLIIVRADSGISNLKDLKSKKIIFGGDMSAMMSYLIPKKMLEDVGLKSTDYNSSFALNPPNALLAVALGQADACGVGDPIPDLKVVKEKINMKELKIIAQSKQYPHLAWAVKNDMDKSLKLKLKNALLQLNNTEKGIKILTRAKLTGIYNANENEYNSMLKFVGDEYND